MSILIATMLFTLGLLIGLLIGNDNNRSAEGVNVLVYAMAILVIPFLWVQRFVRLGWILYYRNKPDDSARRRFFYGPVYQSTLFSIYRNLAMQMVGLEPKRPQVKLPKWYEEDAE